MSSASQRRKRRARRSQTRHEDILEAEIPVVNLDSNPCDEITIEPHVEFNFNPCSGSVSIGYEHKMPNLIRSWIGNETEEKAAFEATFGRGAEAYPTSSSAG
tara:strand:- start:1030 stop:1335 length:306 start_codon:yes stop_codon:yes gene_type:complete